MGKWKLLVAGLSACAFLGCGHSQSSEPQVREVYEVGIGRSNPDAEVEPSTEIARVSGRDSGDVETTHVLPSGVMAPAADPLVVSHVETTLQSQGIEPGPVDSKIDPALHDGLREYQREKGLPATGELDRATGATMGLELPLSDDTLSFR